MSHFVWRNIVRFLIIFALAVLPWASLPDPAVAAGNMYLSPATQTVSAGKQFSIEIRVNAGDERINAVQSLVRYAPEQLEFVNISSAGTAFPIEAPSSGGQGLVSISRGVIGAGVTGDVRLASIIFKPLLAKGNSQISIESGSAIIRSSDQRNLFTGGNAVTVSSSRSGNTTPAGNRKNNPKKIKVSDLNYVSATVSWTTDVPTTGGVEYGLDSSYGLLATQSSPTTTHSVALPTETLVPGTTYHYRVMAEDADNLKVYSEDAVFSTPGYKVNLSLKDESGRALPNTRVTVLSGTSQSTKTDNKGNAMLTNLPPGNVPILVTSGSQSVATTMTVPSANSTQLARGNVATRPITVKVAGIQYQSGLAVILMATLVALMTVLACGIWWVRRRLRRQSVLMP